MRYFKKIGAIARKIGAMAALLIAMAMGCNAEAEAKTVKNHKCSDGWTYTGEMQGGKRHGQGTAISPKGNSYTGRWVDNHLPSGTMKTTSGARYTGPFDKKMYACGFGIMEYTEGPEAGSVYVGNFASGMRNGIGKLTDRRGNIAFGRWKAGELQKPKGQRFTPGDRAYGIDLSHHNPNIDWDNLALYADADGNVHKIKGGTHAYLQPVAWVYVRATEGATVIDRVYASYMAAAKAHGLPRGSYHLMKFTTSTVEDQIQNFLKASNYCRGDELPPVLDLESADAAKAGKEEVMRMALKWLREVEKATGLKPLIYAHDDFIRKYLDLSRLKGYEFWKPCYGVKSSQEKKRPAKPYAIWQFTEWGEISGGNGGKYDIDVYDGSVKDFYKKYLRKK